MGVRTVVIERKSEMKAKVSWVEGMKFVGESESGHQVTLDGANPGEGASPMEMILLAVGGCSSIDVVSILEKARQSVTACHVELEGERADSVPRVFEKIHLKFVVTGKGLAEKQVARDRHREQRAVECSEAVGGTRQRDEFAGAHRGEVGGVRKQQQPAPAKARQVDRAHGGARFEIGGDVANPQHRPNACS